MKENELKKLEDAEAKEEELLLSPGEVCSPEFAQGCIANEEI